MVVDDQIGRRELALGTAFEHRGAPSPRTVGASLLGVDATPSVGTSVAVRFVTEE